MLPTPIANTGKPKATLTTRSVHRTGRQFPIDRHADAIAAENGATITLYTAVRWTLATARSSGWRERDEKEHDPHQP